MRKILLAGICLLLAAPLWAQNRTLGVGVTTPNPNAALHVESPTGNQGLLLPRLTTAQRLDAAFLGALGDADNGLMVYDTDLRTLYIWNGSTWQTSAQVAGGVQLSYPYDDTVTLATGTADLFALRYTHDEPKRIVRLENHSALNGSSVLSISNAGAGLGAYVQNTNPDSYASAIWAQTNSNTIDPQTSLAPVAVYGESIGTNSLGGSFRNQNPENTQPALWVETLGTGSSLHAVTGTGFSAILGEAQGGWSNGVAGVSHSDDPGSYAVLGQNLGGGPAGMFSVANQINTSSAMEASTNGLGAAARFAATNPASGADAVIVNSHGMGRGLFIERHNTETTQPAIFVSSQGGRGVWVDHNGLTGNAGIFQNLNAQNNDIALFAEAVGGGASIMAHKSQPGSTGSVIDALHEGSYGAAGGFEITNSENTAAAVNAVTNGGGPAVRGENTGAGDGFAGEFRTSNPANNYPAIQAESAGNASAIRVTQSTGPGAGIDVFMQNTTSTEPGIYVAHMGDAPGLAVDHQNNGVAIDIRTGALKYSVVTVSTAGPIMEVAGLYKITVTGTFALPTNVPEGTVCKLYNGAGADITVQALFTLGTQSPLTIVAGNIEELVFIDGAWHRAP